MTGIPGKAISLLKNQGFAVISTIDPDGRIHCSVKGYADADPRGKLYFIDLYRGRTFVNLKRSPVVTVTFVNEQEFCGFSLKGSAKITDRGDISEELAKRWDEVVVERASRRVVEDVRRDIKTPYHPESVFPKLQYLIDVTVEIVVDLTPEHLKR